MNNKKTNKMPGAEHTYGNNEPSEQAKELKKWKKEHIKGVDVEEIETSTGEKVEYVIKETGYPGAEEDSTKAINLEVNGHKLMLSYFDSPGGYEIHVVDIDGMPDKILSKFGIGDASIQIGTTNFKEAKKVFEKAVEYASRTKSPVDLYLRLEAYIRANYRKDYLR